MKQNTQPKAPDAGMEPRASSASSSSSSSVAPPRSDSSSTAAASTPQADSPVESPSAHLADSSSIPAAPAPIGAASSVASSSSSAQAVPSVAKCRICKEEKPIDNPAKKRNRNFAPEQYAELVMDPMCRQCTAQKEAAKQAEAAAQRARQRKKKKKKKPASSAAAASSTAAVFSSPATVASAVGSQQPAMCSSVASPAVSPSPPAPAPSSSSSSSPSQPLNEAELMQSEPANDDGKKHLSAAEKRHKDKWEELVSSSKAPWQHTCAEELLAQHQSFSEEEDRLFEWSRDLFQMARADAKKQIYRATTVSQLGKLLRAYARLLARAGLYHSPSDDWRDAPVYGEVYADLTAHVRICIGVQRSQRQKEREPVRSPTLWRAVDPHVPSMCLICLQPIPGSNACTSSHVAPAFMLQLREEGIMEAKGHYHQRKLWEINNEKKGTGVWMLCNHNLHNCDHEIVDKQFENDFGKSRFWADFKQLLSQEEQRNQQNLIIRSNFRTGYFDDNPGLESIRVGSSLLAPLLVSIMVRSADFHFSAEWFYPPDCTLPIAPLLRDMHRFVLRPSSFSWLSNFTLLLLPYPDILDLHRTQPLARLEQFPAWVQLKSSPNTLECALHDLFANTFIGAQQILNWTDGKQQACFTQFFPPFIAIALFASPEAPAADLEALKPFQLSFSRDTPIQVSTALRGDRTSASRQLPRKWALEIIRKMASSPALLDTVLPQTKVPWMPILPCSSMTLRIKRKISQQYGSLH